MPHLSHAAIPAAQFVCLLTMIITWSLVIAWWRLDRATGFLTWAPRQFWLHRLMLLCPPLAMILCGLAVPFGRASQVILWTIVLLATINTLWLLGAFGLRAFAKSRHRLRRACIADAMIPALAAAAAAGAVFPK